MWEKCFFRPTLLPQVFLWFQKMVVERKGSVRGNSFSIMPPSSRRRSLCENEQKSGLKRPIRREGGGRTNSSLSSAFLAPRLLVRGQNVRMCIPKGICIGTTLTPFLISRRSLWWCASRTAFTRLTVDERFTSLSSSPSSSSSSLPCSTASASLPSSFTPLFLPSLRTMCHWHFLFHALQTYGDVIGIVQTHSCEDEGKGKKTLIGASPSLPPAPLSFRSSSRVLLQFQWRSFHDEEKVRWNRKDFISKVYRNPSVTIAHTIGEKGPEKWKRGWEEESEDTKRFPLASFSLSSSSSFQIPLVSTLLPLTCPSLPFPTSSSSSHKRWWHTFQSCVMSSRALLLHLLLVNASVATPFHAPLQEGMFLPQISSSHAVVPLDVSSHAMWCTVYQRTHTQLSTQLPRQWENLFQQWCQHYRPSCSSRPIVDAFLFSSSDRMKEQAEEEKNGHGGERCPGRWRSLSSSPMSHALAQWTLHMEAEEVWTVTFLYGTSRVGRAQWYRYNGHHDQGKRGPRWPRRHRPSTRNGTVHHRDDDRPTTDTRGMSLPFGQHGAMALSSPRESESGIVARLLLPLSESFSSPSPSSFPSSPPSRNLQKRKEEEAEGKNKGKKHADVKERATMPFAIPVWIEGEEEEEQASRGSMHWRNGKEGHHKMADAQWALEWLQHIVERGDGEGGKAVHQMKETEVWMTGKDDKGSGSMSCGSSCAVSSSLETTVRWGKRAYALLAVMDEILCFGDTQKWNPRGITEEEEEERKTVGRAGVYRTSDARCLDPLPSHTQTTRGSINDGHDASSWMSKRERNSPVSYCCCLPLQLYGRYFFGCVADTTPPSHPHTSEEGRFLDDHNDSTEGRKPMHATALDGCESRTTWMDTKWNEAAPSNRRLPRTMESGGYPPCRSTATTAPKHFFWRRMQCRLMVLNAMWDGPKHHTSPTPPCPSPPQDGPPPLSHGFPSPSPSLQWASDLLSRWIRSSGDEFCALPPSFRFFTHPSLLPSSSSFRVGNPCGVGSTTLLRSSSFSVFDAYWAQLFFIYESILVESVAVAAAAAAAASISLSATNRKCLESDEHKKMENDFGVVTKVLYHASGVLFVLHRIISSLSLPATSSSSSFSSASPSTSSGRSARPMGRRLSRRSSATGEGHFLSSSVPVTRGPPMRHGVQPLLALQAQFSGGPSRHCRSSRYDTRHGHSPPPPCQPSSSPCPPVSPFPSDWRRHHRDERESERAEAAKGEAVTEWWRWSMYWRPGILQGQQEGVAMPMWWWHTKRRGKKHADSVFSSFRAYAALWRELVRTDCVFLLSIGHASEKAEDLREWVEACAKVPAEEAQRNGWAEKTMETEKKGSHWNHRAEQQTSASRRYGRGRNPLHDGEGEVEQQAWRGEKSVAQVCQLFADVQQHVRVLQELQGMHSSSSSLFQNETKTNKKNGHQHLVCQTNQSAFQRSGEEEKEKEKKADRKRVIMRRTESEDDKEEEERQCFMLFLAAHLSPGVITSLLTRAQEALRVSTKYFLVWCDRPFHFPVLSSSSSSLLSCCQTRIRVFLSHHLSSSSSPAPLHPPHPFFIMALPSYLCESMDVAILLGALGLWNASLYCCEALMGKSGVQPPLRSSSLTTTESASCSALTSTTPVREKWNATRRGQDSHSTRVDMGQKNESVAALQAVHRLLHSMRFRDHLSQSIREAARELFVGLAQCDGTPPTTTPTPPFLRRRDTPPLFPDKKEVTRDDPPSFFPFHSHQNLNEGDMHDMVSCWLRCWRHFLSEHIHACQGVLPPAVVVHLAVEGALESGVQPYPKKSDENEDASEKTPMPAGTIVRRDRVRDGERDTSKKGDAASTSVRASSSFSSLPWAALLLSQYTHPVESGSDVTIPTPLVPLPLSPAPLLSKTALRVLEEVTREFFLRCCSSVSFHASVERDAKKTRRKKRDPAGEEENTQEEWGKDEIDFSFCPSSSSNLISFPHPTTISIQTFLSYWSALIWCYPLLSASLFTGITACWLIEDQNTRREKRRCFEVSIRERRRLQKTTMMRTAAPDKDDEANRAPEEDGGGKRKRFGASSPSYSMRQRHKKSWIWRHEMMARLEMEENQKKISRIAMQQKDSPMTETDATHSHENGVDADSRDRFASFSPFYAHFCYYMEEQLLDWLSILYQQASVAATSEPSSSASASPSPVFPVLSGRWQWDCFLLATEKQSEERTAEKNTKERREGEAEGNPPKKEEMTLASSFLRGLSLPLQYRLQEVLWRHRGQRGEGKENKKKEKKEVNEVKRKHRPFILDANAPSSSSSSSSFSSPSSSSSSSTIEYVEKESESAVKNIFSPSSSLWNSVKWRTISTALAAPPPPFPQLSPTSTSHLYPSSFYTSIETARVLFASLLQEVNVLLHEWRAQRRRKKEEKEYTRMLQHAYSQLNGGGGGKMENKTEEKDWLRHSLLHTMTEMEGKGLCSILPFPMLPQTLPVLRYHPANVLQSSSSSSETHRSTGINGQSAVRKSTLPRHSFSALPPPLQEGQVANPSHDKIPKRSPGKVDTKKWHKMQRRREEKVCAFIQRFHEVRFLLEEYPERTPMVSFSPLSPPQQEEETKIHGVHDDGVDRLAPPLPSHLSSHHSRPWRCPYCLYWNAGRIDLHTPPETSQRSSSRRWCDEQEGVVGDAVKATRTPMVGRATTATSCRGTHPGGCACCGTKRGGWLWCRTCAQLTSIPRTLWEWKTMALTQLLQLREQIYSQDEEEAEAYDAADEEDEEDVEENNHPMNAHFVGKEGVSIPCWCCEAELCRVVPTLSASDKGVAMTPLHATQENGEENTVEVWHVPEERREWRSGKESSTCMGEAELGSTPLKEWAPRPVFFSSSSAAAAGVEKQRVAATSLHDEREETWRKESVPPPPLHSSRPPTTIATASKRESTPLRVGDGIYLAIQATQVAGLWWWDTWRCNTCQALHFPTCSPSPPPSLFVSSFSRGLAPPFWCSSCGALPSLPSDAVPLLLLHGDPPLVPSERSSAQNTHGRTGSTMEGTKMTSSPSPSFALLPSCPSAVHEDENEKSDEEGAPRGVFPDVLLSSTTFFSASPASTPPFGDVTPALHCTVCGMAPPGMKEGDGRVSHKRVRMTWKEKGSHSRSRTPAGHDVAGVHALPPQSMAGDVPTPVYSDIKKEGGEGGNALFSLCSSPRPYCVFCGALQLQWCQHRNRFNTNFHSKSDMKNSDGKMKENGNHTMLSMESTTCSSSSSIVGTLWQCVECETAHPWYVSVCHVCETSLLDTLIRRRWCKNVLHQHEWISFSSLSSPPLTRMKNTAATSFWREVEEKEEEENVDRSTASSKQVRLQRSSSPASSSPPCPSLCSCCGATVQWMQRRCWRCGTAHASTTLLPCRSSALSLLPHSCLSSKCDASLSSSSPHKRDLKRHVEGNDGEESPSQRRFASPSLQSGTHSSWKWFPPCLSTVMVPGVFAGPSPPPTMAISAYCVSLPDTAGGSSLWRSEAMQRRDCCGMDSSFSFPPLQCVLDSILYLPLHENMPHALRTKIQSEGFGKGEEDKWEGHSLRRTKATEWETPSWRTDDTNAKSEWMEKKEEKQKWENENGRPNHLLWQQQYEPSWRSWWMMVRARMLQNESTWWEGTAASPLSSTSCNSMSVRTTMHVSSFSSSLLQTENGSSAMFLYIFPPSSSSPVLPFALPFTSEGAATHLSSAAHPCNHRWNSASRESNEFDDVENEKVEERTVPIADRDAKNSGGSSSSRSGENGKGKKYDFYFIGCPPSSGISALVQEAALVKRMQQYFWKRTSYFSSFSSFYSSPSREGMMEKKRDQKSDAGGQEKSMVKTVPEKNTISSSSTLRMGSAAELTKASSESENNKKGERKGEEKVEEPSRIGAYNLPCTLPPSFSTSFLATLLQQARMNSATTMTSRCDSEHKHHHFHQTDDSRLVTFASSFLSSSFVTSWLPIHFLGSYAMEEMRRHLEKLFRIASTSTSSFSVWDEREAVTSTLCEGDGLFLSCGSFSLLSRFLSIVRELSMWLEVLTHSSFPKDALPWRHRAQEVEVEQESMLSSSSCGASPSSFHWSLAKQLLNRMIDVLILLRHWERKEGRQGKKSERTRRKDTITRTIATAATSSSHPVLSSSSFCWINENMHASLQSGTSFPCVTCSYSSLWALRCYWFGLTLSWMELLRCNSPFPLDDLGFETLSRVAVEVYYYYHYRPYAIHPNREKNTGTSGRATTGPPPEDKKDEWRLKTGEQDGTKKRKEHHDIEMNSGSLSRTPQRKRRKRKKTEMSEVRVEYFAPPSSSSISSASSFLTLHQYTQELRYAYLLTFQLSAEEMLATAAASACSLPYRLVAASMTDTENTCGVSSTVRSSALSPPSSSLLPTPQLQSTNERTLVFPTSPSFHSNSQRRKKRR